MICWECKKPINTAVLVRYLEFHEEVGMSKEKSREVCDECYEYLKLEKDACHFVRVKRIAGKKLRFRGDGWHNRFKFRVLTPDGKRQETTS